MRRNRKGTGISRRLERFEDRAKPMNIGIPLYPDFDPLDVIGPYEIFSWMARMWGEQTTHVLLVAATLKPVTSFSNLTITPVRTFVDCPALDVLFVPGGSPASVTAMMKNEDYISFLRKQGGDAAYISSVCVGALLLAAAGLLNGYKATTHWAFVSSLQLFPKIKVEVSRTIRETLGREKF
jgi:transcriptional regulator GlxA family with amidase domain